LHDLIFERMEGVTSLIIAHRLSTIVSCDTICFIEQGWSIEQGSHEELIALDGKYAKMIGLFSCC